MNAVHPIFDQFCRVVSGDAARAAMKGYRVRVIKDGRTVYDFEAMGRNTIEVVMQHMDLAEGAKLDVQPLEGKQ